jgi:hypothetical protein
MTRRIALRASCDENRCDTFQASPILGAKPRDHGAIEVWHAEQTAIPDQRDHKFGERCRVAGDVGPSLKACAALVGVLLGVILRRDY